MGGDQGQVPRREHGECMSVEYYQLKVDSQLFDFEASDSQSQSANQTEYDMN